MRMIDYLNWYESVVIKQSSFLPKNVRNGLLHDYYPGIKEIFLADVKSKYPFADLNENSIVQLLATDLTIEACLLYRIQREIFLRQGQEAVALGVLSNVMKTRTGTEIYYSTAIGKGLNIQHGTGLVIGPRFVIGENFMVHQNVTLGQRRGPQDVITIGNNVIIYAGAKILGNVRIGDNAKIAANAVLLTDALADSTYVGVPAKKVT